MESLSEDTFKAEVHRLDDLRLAETRRVDDLRRADAAAISVASERAIAQAIVLANQVSASAETLRVLVATTAATSVLQLSQIDERLKSLEKAQNENRGSSGGMRDMYGWIIAALMFLVGIGGFLYKVV